MLFISISLRTSHTEEFVMLVGPECGGGCIVNKNLLWPLCLNLFSSLRGTLYWQKILSDTTQDYMGPNRVELTLLMTCKKEINI